MAVVPNDGIGRGLKALVSELKRVTTFGFTATELDRAKQANLAASERAAEESPDRKSSSRADEYTRDFLQREALPTISQLGDPLGIAGRRPARQAHTTAADVDDEQDG